MDAQRDFKGFQEVMDELSATLRKGAKASDALLRAYWDLLKDAPLSEVQENAKRIRATATKDTHFPLPRELRNRPPSIDAFPDARRDAAMRLNEQTWRELHAKEPARYRVESGIARAARELAKLDPEDPGYDEWLREYQRWNAQRYLPGAG